MQTYVMKKGETLFPECYNQQNMKHGQRDDNNELTKTPTTQNRQHNSTKQHTNSTRGPTKIHKLCLIYARLGKYIYQKERSVLKTFYNR